MSAEEAQHRVQTALSDFVDDIEKSKLRQMQVNAEIVLIKHLLSLTNIQY